MAEPDAGVVDSLEDVNRIRDAVETAIVEDEPTPTPLTTNEDDDAPENDDADKNGDDKDPKDTTESDADAEEEEDDGNESDPKPEAKSTDFKFKQFVDENPTAHISNLEQAYSKSSAEGVRLHNELQQTQRRVDAIVSAAAADPDLAQRLNKVLQNPSQSGDPTGGSTEPTESLEDPFLTHLRVEMREKSIAEVKDILESHPEIASDPELGQRVKYWMDTFAAAYRKENNGKLMSGGDAMRAAMKYLGIDEKSEKQQTASTLKNLAAPTRPTASRKSAKTSDKKPVSDAAISFGAAMGVSREKIEKYAN
jgi:hypothetical protein